MLKTFFGNNDTIQTVVTFKRERGGGGGNIYSSCIKVKKYVKAFKMLQKITIELIT